MNRTAVYKLVAILLGAGGFGAARSADDGPAVDPGVLQQTGAHHAAPSGPFGLSYEILGTPEPGQPIEVLVEVVPPLPLSYVSVEVYAYDGLVVSPLNFSVTAPPAGEAVEQTLVVTPYAEGALRLALLVSGDAYGETQYGQLTIPVVLGEPRPDPAVTNRLRTTPEGEMIISLPASEN